VVQSAVEVETMVDKDRRTSLRYEAKAGNYVIYVEGSGGIRDLSMDGVFVLDPEPLPVGTTINFSLHLGTQDIAVQSIVRRSDSEGMGIQFIEMSAEARRRLRLHLASLVGK
jgi:hypothetical protein